jgi:hypothetical protein
MPRWLDWEERADPDFSLYRYSDIAAENSVQVVTEADEGFVCPISAETVPVGGFVFSRYIDGYSPFVSRLGFHQEYGYWPEMWSYPEPECYDCGNPESACSCRFCDECGSRMYDGEQCCDYDPYGEETTDDPSAQDSPLRIPALPDRPTRCMSMEIEVGRGGNVLAEAFYHAGLSDSSHMRGYHSGDHDSFVCVEEDASVAAEIIFSKMYLSRPGHSANFERGLGILKQAIANGQSKLDMRCGLHIHVSLERDRTAKAKGFTRENCISLYHLWNYLEDTIFRLGSANWKGHRSEFGNEYSPVVPKREISRPHDLQFGRCALNLSNYLSVLARRDNSDPYYGGEAIPTVEFRVFNTSANTRKIRAYAALCQALVAYAGDHKITSTEFPVFSWTCHGEPDMRASQERIEFILTKLPLTNSEQEDLRYCMRKSSLASCL